MRWKIRPCARVLHRVRVVESHVEFMQLLEYRVELDEYLSIAWISSSTRIVYYASPKSKLDYSRVLSRVRVTLHS